MQRQRRSPFFTFGLVGASAFLVASFAAACGGPSKDSAFDNGDNTDGSTGEGGLGLKNGEGGGGCTGIACNVASCGSAPDTTISGTVYAPNGTLPLYNVIVFVPNTPLEPFTDGVSCDACGTVSGNPVTSTVSNPDGTFKLTGVPVGANIPLVFQVGKWRRQVTISNVAKCQDNPITDPNMERLPKNHTEGDMPHIAVTTGDCDKIACVLPRMGIDASEFGIASDYATKRVIFYQGNGTSTISNSITPAQTLWGDINELKKYDVAIFSCECDESMENKTGDQGTVLDYLNAGGRTFGTDFMYTWIHPGNGDPAADAVPAPLPNIMESFVGDAPENTASTYTVDQTFPKGAALAQWLKAVGASTTVGTIPLQEVYANFGKSDPTLSQRWIYDSSHDDVISFTTPQSEPEANRCGKSYYLEPHVGPIDSPDTVDTSFPENCKDSFTAQQKALVFFLMDLASCIQDDTAPVNPPR
jgi:hypothetical protein